MRHHGAHHALVLRDSFPNIYLKIRLQGPALPHIAENTQQYYPETWIPSMAPPEPCSIHPQWANDCSLEHEAHTIKKV